MTPVKSVDSTTARLELLNIDEAEEWPKKLTSEECLRLYCLLKSDLQGKYHHSRSCWHYKPHVNHTQDLVIRSRM